MKTDPTDDFHIPDFAMSAASPTVFIVAVFPPMLGPVIATTFVPWLTLTSIGTGAFSSNSAT